MSTLTRRDVMTGAAAAGLLISGGQMRAEAQQGDAPVVTIAAGALRGSRKGRLDVFRGVPYARAERFGAPEPVAAWSGVRDAIEPGPVCPQMPSRLEFIMGTPKEKRAMSEDCQVLSVFTPDRSGKRPVMVWFHGGAYVTGGGEEAWYDASRLADDGDVVAVTVTYRLGVFGYLFTDERGAANGGLQDQKSALRWVKENIAAFGGDPANVTVFGQSAGGHSIAALMTANEPMPFRRAILQSAPVSSVTTLEDAKTIGKEFRAALGASPLTASTAEMLAAQKTVLAGSSRGLTFAPIGIDTQRAAPPAEPKIDFLFTFARDDAAPFVALQHKDRPYGGIKDDVLTRLGTHKLFSGPTEQLAASLHKAGHRTAVWEIVWRPKGSPYGAPHCIELPLLFGSEADWQGAPLLGDAPAEQVRRFGKEARAIWAAFARSGEQPHATEWLRQEG